MNKRQRKKRAKKIGKLFAEHAKIWVEIGMEQMKRESEIMDKIFSGIDNKRAIEKSNQALNSPWAKSFSVGVLKP